MRRRGGFCEKRGGDGGIDAHVASGAYKLSSIMIRFFPEFFFKKKGFDKNTKVLWFFCLKMVFFPIVASNFILFYTRILSQMTKKWPKTRPEFFIRSLSRFSNGR